MSDALLTADYIESVASSIEDALMNRGIGQRTVQVAVCSSDAKTMQEAAVLLRDMGSQIKAMTETLTASADALTYLGATLHAQRCRNVLDLIQKGGK
jgi:hypothetical protein